MSTNLDDMSYAKQMCAVVLYCSLQSTENVQISHVNMRKIVID